MEISWRHFRRPLTRFACRAGQLVGVQLICSTKQTLILCTFKLPIDTCHALLTCSSGAVGSAIANGCESIQLRTRWRWSTSAREPNWTGNWQLPLELEPTLNISWPVRWLAGLAGEPQPVSRMLVELLFSLAAGRCVLRSLSATESTFLPN